ncbi:MAG: HPr family phosphocarrier protein [Gammaproteobacteria bacterium]|nr:HPr family phosphocarrier protein [Gammaproteobacteria bacterium]
MIEENITIINKLGLHTRAAAKLVALAGRFQCSIELIHQGTGQIANCKSIMALMLMGAARGAHLTLKISGADELDARDAIVALVNSRFGEAE